MKQIVFFAFILIGSSMIGCKSSNDPKGVLMNFMDAMTKKDFTSAKKYATKESDAMLGMLETMMKMSPDSSKDKKFDKDNLEYGDAKIDGNKATVPVKNRQSGETTNYTLKKEDGQWKVAFDKASMGGDKMKTTGSEGVMPDSSGNMMNNMNKMGADSSNSMRPDSSR